MLQTMANGIVAGMLYAVLGVSFSLVYSTSRVFFIGLGGICTLAPYIALAVIKMNLPNPVAALSSILVCGGLAVLCEILVHWPLQLKKAPTEVHFIASLGVFICLGQVAVMIWGNDVQVLRAGIGRVLQIGSLRLAYSQILGFCASAVSLFVVLLWLRNTSAGLRFRALASNTALLSTLGHNVRAIRIGVFALSGGLASVVALCLGVDIGFDPHSGMRAVLIGLTAAVVGGRNSFGGAVAAGLALGVIRAQVVWHTSARWEDVATFGLLAVCLLTVPGGIKSLVHRRQRVEEAL